MGNSKGKQQKPSDGDKTAVQGDVVRRDRSGDRSRSNRPLSDPGISTTVDMFPAQNPNVFLRPKDSMDLSGRKYGPSSRGSTYHGERSGLTRHNSDRRLDYGEPRADYFVSESPLASMLKERDSPSLDAYHRAVNQLVIERPEYEPLKTLDFSSLSQPLLETLALIFNRMNDQGDQIDRIERLSKERRELDLRVRELGDDRRHLSKENSALREDIKILRDELRKRGAAERERLRSTGETRDSGSDSLDRTPRSPPPIEEEPPPGKKGIYMPTPLLQAEGGAEKTRNAVVRKESLRPVGAQPRSGYRSTSESADNEIIRKLQTENAELNDRIKVLEKGTSPYSTLPRRSIKPRQLTEQFNELEQMALHKVFSTIRHHLGHVNDQRQRQFLCSVMQTAYDVSSKVVARFRETVQQLLMNPMKLESAPLSNGLPKVSSNAAITQAKKQFEVPSEPRKISKLAARTIETSKMPEALNRQINEYLEGMAESVNLASLIEEVADTLMTQYSECITPAVLNQAVFNQFTHDCCRTAWQMCVIIPPFYVTMEDNYRFDDRRHTAFEGQKVVTNAKINYFLWPELLSRKDGDVLHKGIVCLKT